MFPVGNYVETQSSVVPSSQVCKSKTQVLNTPPVCITRLGMQYHTKDACEARAQTLWNELWEQVQCLQYGNAELAKEERMVHITRCSVSYGNVVV